MSILLLDAEDMMGEGMSSRGRDIGISGGLLHLLVIKGKKVPGTWGR